MTLLEKIKNLTWFNLVELLQEILQDLNKVINVVKLEILSAQISEAPVDNFKYARENKEWVKIIAEVPKYKVFSGIISQNGINEPVVTVLENTLGYNLVFGRIGVGLYQIHTTAYNPIFTIGKTQMFFGLHSFSEAAIVTSNTNQYPDLLEFFTMKCVGNVFSDSFLINNSVEIRVYN